MPSPETDVPDLVPGPAGGKGPWIVVISIVVVCGLSAAIFGVWTGVSSAQRAKTPVTWSGPLECSGSRVTQEQSFGDDRIIETMRAQPLMRCTLRFDVTNRGWLPVTVTQVRLPFMGPGGGPPVRVARFDGRTPKKVDDGDTDPIDAVFATNRRVSSGETTRFVIEFTFREHACSSEGLLWIGELPGVTVRAIGNSGVVTAEDLIGVRITQDFVSKCRE